MTTPSVATAVGGGPAVPMVHVDGTSPWRARSALARGLHRVAVGTDGDAIRLLVHAGHGIPRRGLGLSPGCDIHSAGPWPERGVGGTQRGPTKNGVHP